VVRGTEIKNNKADFVIKGAQKALLTTFLTDKVHAKGLEGVFLKYISVEQAFDLPKQLRAHILFIH
jgi:hypothetical protein